MALGVIVAAALLRLAFDPVWGGRLPFITFYPAVVVAAWLGGFGPGLLVTLLGAGLADYFWMAPTGSLAIADGGDLAGLVAFIGVGVAISALTRVSRRAATAVSQSDERFRLALEAAPAAMVMVDVEGRIVLVNALTESLLGYGRAELVGQPVDRLVPARFRNRHADHWSAFFRGPERRPMGAGRDLYAERRDGTEVPVEIGLSPLETPDGTFVVAAITDITQRKRAEQAERDAKWEAEAANRAKDQFLAIVSHELRTPLNTILGWAHLLLGGGLPEAQHRRAIEVIRSNATRQAELIEQLLDVSRILSGKLTLERAAVDLPDAVRTALDEVRPEAQARGLDVALDIDPAVGPVHADANRVQQILGNLLSNAVKFSARGGAIQVRVRASDGMAEVDVTDTGSGIAPDFLPFVFEAFRQASVSTSRRHSGLGLGLSIVRHLVEAHGGTVSARSEGEDRGATFAVRLPFVIGPADQAPRPRRAGTRNAASSLGGISVLVVDDDADARELVATTLGGYQAVVRRAASTAEALDVLAREPIHVLLADLVMPGEDGYALIRKVRQLPSSSCDVPAAALTALARAEDRERALRAGFQVHLTKPIEPDALVAEVAHLAGVKTRAHA